MIRVLKAISLWEPWATLIALGLKTIETRTWSTSHRGPLLICASKRTDGPALKKYGRKATALRLLIKPGHAVALVEVQFCRKMQPKDTAAAWCPWETKRWAWGLANIRPIEPFPVRGRQRFFNVDIPEKFRFSDGRHIR